MELTFTLYLTAGAICAGLSGAIYFLVRHG